MEKDKDDIVFFSRNSIEEDAENQSEVKVNYQYMEVTIC
tara:strand:- start:2303 stop:2419 length:117 start_codon:yes stop_codon:yes gene_type:complete